MSRIRTLNAREILDSRGNPTIEVSLKTEQCLVKASVPSGASVGKYEAVELRDNDKRYNGLGVLKAINNINKTIAPKLKDKSVVDQKGIDNLLINLDGTDNKSKIGANAILAVSMAICRAGAIVSEKKLYNYIAHLYGQDKVSLPQLSFNVINGGVHAGNDLDFQEFMIVPKKKKINEAVREATEIYHSLKKDIKKRYSSMAVNVGDEGGFAPPVSDPEDAIKLILDNAKIGLIIDVAAGEFKNTDGYKMGIKSFNGEEFVNYYLYLARKYPILGIEDPFHEDDWQNWHNLSSRLKKQKSNLLIIGDDLLATNPKRIQQAEQEKACNAMILKINQIGTISESIQAAKLAKSFKWKIIVSHRSGETNDDFISDFATGISADFIKSGAPARGERVAKYNRLMEIEQELQN